MAKHVHKYYKMPTEAKSKYMWKCTDCAWFVHAGLEYVMIGKPGECWNCGDIFQVDERALRQDKPRCSDCSVMETIKEDKLEDKPEVIEVVETDEDKAKRERNAKMWEEIRKDIFRHRR